MRSETTVSSDWLGGGSSIIVDVPSPGEYLGVQTTSAARNVDP